ERQRGRPPATRGQSTPRRLPGRGGCTPRPGGSSAAVAVSARRGGRRGRGRRGRGCRGRSADGGGMPDANVLEALALHVAALRVLHERVQRLAAVGDLERA